MLEKATDLLFDFACPQCGTELTVRRGDAKNFRATVDVDGYAEVEVVYLARHRCERVGLR